MKLNKKGFTLAEVLITLAIIGVIAAILFPSILANYNERTLKAKRQALFARMSQAMAELSDDFGSYVSAKDRAQTEAEIGSGYIPNCSANSLDCVDDGSALKFINQGLSKVYKIAAVCDNETLSACDIPEEIIKLDGSKFTLYDASSILDFNPDAKIGKNYLRMNSDAAAFVTKNGESILLFYNPYCLGKPDEDATYYIETRMCVNMIYDLNGGKNKPNRLGEDVGVMTVFYSDSPNVVSPRPVDIKSAPDFDVTQYDLEGVTTDFNNIYKYTFEEAKSICASYGDNVALPNKEEGMSMLFNMRLFWDYTHETNLSNTTKYFWTSTTSGTPGNVRVIRVSKSDEVGLLSTAIAKNNTANGLVRCVYTD